MCARTCTTPMLCCSMSNEQCFGVPPTRIPLTYDVTGQILCIIADLLLERVLCVKFGGVIPNFISIGVGKSQGTELGPIL